MENINLSSLTPMANKEVAIFSENNLNTYKKYFDIAGVTYTASPNNFIHLASQIQGNYKLEKTVCPSLMSISQDDFRP